YWPPPGGTPLNPPERLGGAPPGHPPLPQSCGTVRVTSGAKPTPGQGPHEHPDRHHPRPVRLPTGSRRPLRLPRRSPPGNPDPPVPDRRPGRRRSSHHGPPTPDQRLRSNHRRDPVDHTRGHRNHPTADHPITQPEHPRARVACSAPQPPFREVNPVPVKDELITQAYRYALDPTPAQERAFTSHVGGARLAYNWGPATYAAALHAREAEKAAGE